MSCLPLRRLFWDQGVQKKKKVTGQGARKTGKTQGKRGDLERATVDSEGFGDETWEIFSLSGVRCDSV
jgi:hypothetical protein